MNVNELKEKMSNLYNMSENDAKQTICEAMSMTQSQLGLEDLSKILSNEQLESMKSVLYDRAKQVFYEREGWSKEEIEDLRQNEVNGEVFFMAHDTEDFTLRRLDFDDMRKKINIEKLDMEEISLQQLGEVALKSLKKHREYNLFYENDYLTGEETKEVLDSSIDGLSKIVKERKNPAEIESLTGNIKKSDLIEAMKEMNSAEIEIERPDDKDIEK